jgi:hypothetical protein
MEIQIHKIPIFRSDVFFKYLEQWNSDTRKKGKAIDIEVCR